MKRIISRNVFLSILLCLAAFLGSSAIAASTGTIDPNNTGAYKAAFLDASTMADTSINFGKFTTESAYNITVSDSELRGYAWGSSVGWIVVNCADTTSGCSGTNGNFKVANDGSGVLSGYAWGENTGWINFGPFTNGLISRVKIDGTTGNFEGTLNEAGYAWSQNYGWIVFDCTNANTCVNTDWRPTVSSGGSSGGGGTVGGTSGGSTGGTGTTTPPDTTPTQPATPPDTTTPPTTTPPSNSNTTTTPPDTAPTEPVTPPSTGPTQPPVGTTTEPSNNPAESTNEPGAFGGGLVLPPVLGETITNIVNSIGNVAVNTAQSAISTAKIVTTAIRTPAGDAVSKVATAAGVATTAAAGIATIAVANPVTASELLFLPWRLWTLLLIFFGYKKRQHPWGTVYDSVTKQPIDPAYVVLMDMQGNEVATSITDIDGRYGFSVPAGTYKIVASKTNYEFPSKKLFGKLNDELYDQLYFGETITTTAEGEVIAKNIPLDQLNFDWNEFAKNQQKRLSYYKHSDVIIARISNVFFWLGFIFAAVSFLAAHTTYNIVVFAIYILIFFLRRTSIRLKAKGSVSDAFTGAPLSFAIVHVISVATGQEVIHKVADRIGNYYCLVPNGNYQVVIDRKNIDASYTKIPISQPIEVHKGYLKEDFKV